MSVARSVLNFVPLTRVRVGDRGRLAVAGLAAGADATVQRLMSMGLIPGAAVEVVRVAPLGDPIMLEVAGYQVSLRRGEAAGLGIERAAPPDDEPSNGA